MQAAEASFFSGKLRLPYNKRAWVGSENLSRNHAITWLPSWLNFFILPARILEHTQHLFLSWYTTPKGSQNVRFLLLFVGNNKIQELWVLPRSTDARHTELCESIIYNKLCNWNIPYLYNIKFSLIFHTYINSKYKEKPFSRL